MDRKPIIYFECDKKACRRCNNPHCCGTSKIEHARNFVKLGYDFVEKTSMENTSSCLRYCEVYLFHKNNKAYWKKYCPRKKKPGRKFRAGHEEVCECCNHVIDIAFFKDKDSKDVRARTIYRKNDIPEGWEKIVRAPSFIEKTLDGDGNE